VVVEEDKLEQAQKLIQKYLELAYPYNDKSDKFIKGKPRHNASRMWYQLSQWCIAKERPDKWGTRFSDVL